MFEDRTAPADGFTLKDVLFILDRIAQFHEKAAKALRGMIRAQKDAEFAYTRLREACSAVAQLFRGFTSGTNRAST
ncbi:hypothetical protein [Streptomyces sp. CL12-4]|uniref:hypothetical protein n=1 Tax=Streptomyces sp. CL12-4 TaxID=2810306 RepID=UPI001EFC1C29|nr:hypothetical protein [Streptomyces sp. CL12-4]MCG8971559.1 hypothetical protein [Streptomyces sp. CL12-4]